MEYRLTLKTPPVSEPLSLQEVKSYLKLDNVEMLTSDNTDIEAQLSQVYCSEENYLLGLISAARQYCEDFQNRSFITQTWEMSLDNFTHGTIELPKGKLQTVNSINYKDSAGNIKSLTNNIDYVYSVRGVKGRIVPAYNKTWPSFTPFPLDAVIIDFTCGYGDASAVPLTVKQSMYLLISHWFENRTPVNMAKSQIPNEIQFTLSSLLWIDRIIPV